MKRLLLLFAVFATASMASAEDFAVKNGNATIYYKKLSDTEAGVTFRGSNAYEYENEYTGNVTIPSEVTYNGTTYTVTRITSMAFHECDQLASVKMPNTIKVIESDAFSRCTGMTSVTLPESVTSLGERAFEEVTKLTTINIPESVTTISYRVFSGCYSLKSFTGKYASDDKRCLIMNDRLVAFAPAGLTSYSIPDSVKTIGNSAFNWCRNLTSINIPSSVTEFENGAFSGCGFTSFVIPNNITKIPQHLLSGCGSLRSVKIPDSVTEIGYCAFDGCFNLTSITLPKSLQTIREDAFSSCTGLKSITIPESVTTIEPGAFSGCNNLSSFSGKFASSDSRCLVVNGALVAFAPSGLTRSYTFPTTVKVIEAWAIRDCTGPTSLVIPSSVEIIGEGAFYKFSTLKALTLPNTKLGIFDYAFWECTSLATIQIESPDPSKYYVGTEQVFASPNKMTLAVPKGSKDLYSTTYPWSTFKTIKEYIPTGIETVMSTDYKVQSTNCYNLQGQKVGSGAKGIVIKNGRKVWKR